MKLTEWFGSDVNPAIPGVYEVEPEGDRPFYSYWNGSHWGYMTCHSIEHAVLVFNEAAYPSMNQWRGLAEKPE